MEGQQSKIIKDGSIGVISTTSTNYTVKEIDHSYIEDSNRVSRIVKSKASQKIQDLLNVEEETQVNQ